MKRGVVILGAAGYVGGELLRLVAAHPHLELAAACSASHAGQPITAIFPHLELAYPQATFAAADAWRALVGRRDLAVFSALPHGAAAPALGELFAVVDAAGAHPLVVDLSGDFRLDAESFAREHGVAHPHPELFERFTAGIPELERDPIRGAAVQPGCFTTATTLAVAPLAALGVTTDRFFVNAITGSTGSGREPRPGTHHPERHANLHAYNPLVHRHQHEMERYATRAAGRAISVAFVPCSGPFARGIHATVHAELEAPLAAEHLVERVRDYYADAPFLRVDARPPTLKSVVGTNLCRLGIATHGREVVVFSVIDNLVKGAAGGAVQWLNRLAGYAPTAGLTSPALGWT